MQLMYNYTKKPTAVCSPTARRICDIYDFFAPYTNVLTYLLTYLLCS